MIHVVEALGGGVFEVVRALADHTAAMDVPTVVIWGNRPETPVDLRAEFDERVRLVEVPGWGERDLASSLRSMLRAARAIRLELAGYEGGIVHLHSSYAGVLGRLGVVRGRRWRLLYSPHGYSFQYESVSPLTRKLARASESILGRRGQTVAVSQAEAELGAGLIGRERILVVQNGVDLPDLRDGRRADGRFVVAVVGRAAVHRRPALVAELAQRLGSGLGVEFVWLGDGDQRAVLAEGGVEVRGWVSRGDLSAALARADAVLHLSAYEGFPIALLEAMAAARPVVASDLPPIREAVGDAGLLVSELGEAEAALRRLHDDPGLRETLGQRARKRVEQNFTKERMLSEALEAYGLAQKPS